MIDKSPSSQTLLLINVLVIFAILLVLGLAFGEELETVSTTIIEKVGILGVVALVLFIETFPTPFGATVPMYIAIQGGYSPWMIGVMTGFTSMLGGHLGYWAGYRFGIPQGIHSLLKKKWPHLEEKITTKGPLGLALLSLVPIPLACLTWPSGALRMPYIGFSIALLTRIPKQILYMLSVVGSIALT
jgi:membrane protein YqaA with SNARE-associated domain